MVTAGKSPSDPYKSPVPAGTGVLWLSLAPHPPKFPLLPTVLPSFPLPQERVGCRRPGHPPGSPRTMSCLSRLTVAASLLAMQV